MRATVTAHRLASSRSSVAAPLRRDEQTELRQHQGLAGRDSRVRPRRRRHYAAG
jgi:hypothetical protein